VRGRLATAVQHVLTLALGPKVRVFLYKVLPTFHET
jgi:hypothetical protein